MRTIKSIFTLTAIFGLMIYQNCSQPGFFMNEEQNNLSSMESIIVEKPSFPHFNLMSANQIHQTFISLTETQESNDIRNEYVLRRNSISDQGEVYAINAPYLLSTTSMAGSFCRTIITRESAQGAQQKFFRGINFTQGIQVISDQQLVSVANTLAQFFWKYPLSQEEQNAIIEFKNTFLQSNTTPIADSPAQTINLMTATCAAILGSINVVAL